MYNTLLKKLSLISGLKTFPREHGLEDENDALEAVCQDGSVFIEDNGAVHYTTVDYNQPIVVIGNLLSICQEIIQVRNCLQTNCNAF